MTLFEIFAIVQRHSILNHRFSKVVQWSKILGRFASVQLLVQAVGMISGILLVRSLSKTDYAYFTLANTMQATMTLLADVGISSGLSAIGGRVWHDRFRFGQLINTALHLRRSLLMLSILVVTPILLWMLLSNGASLGYASIITTAVLIGISFQVTSGVMGIIPRLHLQIGRLQKLDMASALMRLSLIFAAYFLLLNTVTAVLAAVVTFALQCFILQHWARQIVDTHAPINEDDLKSLWAMVRKQAPNDIYFCFQGQIMVWLISIFGSTKNIADIGALGRLAIIFAIIGTTMSSVVLPRFARCQSTKLLKVRYLQILTVFILFGSALVLLAIFLPTQILNILGPKYMHLKSEVALMVLSSAVSGLNGAAWSCNYSKGWICPAWIITSSGIVTQLALILILDISSVRGVLLINIYSSTVAVFINFIVAMRELRKFRDIEACNS